MNVNPIGQTIRPEIQPPARISFADHLAAAQAGLHICSSCYERVEQVFQQHRCRSCLKREADTFRHLFDRDRKF